MFNVVDDMSTKIQSEMRNYIFQSPSGEIFKKPVAKFFRSYGQENQEGLYIFLITTYSFPL